MSGQTITVTIGDKQWTCSVANTYAELVTGLSGVPSLPAGTGMFFDLGYDQKYIEINMSQMLFPLDIIFINSTQGVVGVLGNVEPGMKAYLNNQTYPGARCFLEVNAGEAEGMEFGDNVAIEGYAQPSQFDISSLINVMVIVVMMVAMTKMLEAPKTKPPLPAGYVPVRRTGPTKAPPRITKGEEELQEKKLALENTGRMIARETGVEFLRLEEGWQPKYSTPRYWFKGPKGKEIIARDLEELKWKLSLAGKLTGEYLTHSQANKGYVKIIAPGQTSLTIGSIVTIDELKRENERARKQGEQPATAEVWEGGKPVLIRPKVIPTEKTRAQPDKLEYLADSPEFLTQTIEDIGYRDKLDNAFREAIVRARGTHDLTERITDGSDAAK